MTGGRLEIKTSGRYTYEMGRALFASKNAADQALWRDWYKFTLELALLGLVQRRCDRAEDGARLRDRRAGESRHAARTCSRIPR